MHLSPVEDHPEDMADPEAGKAPTLITREQRDLLCAMAYVALGVGDAEEAVTLLCIVLRETPDDAELLRLLVYALVAAGSGHQALAALDRLEALEKGPPTAPLMLLRSQALRLAGRLDQGREAFRAFVALRQAGDNDR